MINCPLCGVWANVLETRDNKDKTQTRRRYECANEHRFSTVEAVDLRSVNDARGVIGRPRRADLSVESLDN